MMALRVVTISGFVTLAVVAAFADRQVSETDELVLTRSTVDGGGATRCVGGDFELSATIGQPDAGALTGGDFVLTSGFWFGLALGDHNDDGLVNLDDYDVFEQCMNGPSGGPPNEICESFDVNHSGGIDLVDFATVQRTFTGQ